MESTFALAIENLRSPAILAFILGLFAAIARSDLNFSESLGKSLSLYLLFAIGFKGGSSVNKHGLTLELGTAMIAGMLLSALLPLMAFGLLRFFTKLSKIEAAAVSGHYGSISMVTFVAATDLLRSQGIESDGYMVAVAAAMEAPAILAALSLVSKERSGDSDSKAQLLHEILFNGSIVLIIGAFAIGMISGAKGLAQVKPFLYDPFPGVLCLFLLNMGLVAGRGLRGRRKELTTRLAVFAMAMPLLGASLGLVVAAILNFSLGSALLFMVLCGSSSYIAVPAAMRVALPEARPAIYLTLSLAITFPFNLTIGIPLYLSMAKSMFPEL